MSRASEETAKRRERILKPEGDRLGAISALLGDGPTDSEERRASRRAARARRKASLRSAASREDYEATARPVVPPPPEGHGFKTAVSRSSPSGNKPAPAPAPSTEPSSSTQDNNSASDDASAAKEEVSSDMPPGLGEGARRRRGGAQSASPITASPETSTSGAPAENAALQAGSSPRPPPVGVPSFEKEAFMRLCRAERQVALAFAFACAAALMFAVQFERVFTEAHTLYEDVDEFDPEAPEPVFTPATEERRATLWGFPASGVLVLLVLLVRVALSFAFHALRHAWSPNAAAAMEPFPASDAMPAFLSSGPLSGFLSSYILAKPRARVGLGVVLSLVKAVGDVPRAVVAAIALRLLADALGPIYEGVAPHTGPVLFLAVAVAVVVVATVEKKTRKSAFRSQRHHVAMASASLRERARRSKSRAERVFGQTSKPGASADAEGPSSPEPEEVHREAEQAVQTAHRLEPGSAAWEVSWQQSALKQAMRSYAK